jgi:hypothetical protein
LGLEKGASPHECEIKFSGSAGWCKFDVQRWLFNKELRPAADPADYR